MASAKSSAPDFGGGSVMSRLILFAPRGLLDSLILVSYFQGPANSRLPHFLGDCMPNPGGYFVNPGFEGPRFEDLVRRRAGSHKGVGNVLIRKIRFVRKTPAVDPAGDGMVEEKGQNGRCAMKARSLAISTVGRPASLGPADFFHRMSC